MSLPTEASVAELQEGARESTPAQVHGSQLGKCHRIIRLQLTEGPSTSHVILRRSLHSLTPRSNAVSEAFVPGHPAYWSSRPRAHDSVSAEAQKCLVVTSWGLLPCPPVSLASFRQTPVSQSVLVSLWDKPLSRFLSLQVLIKRSMEMTPKSVVSSTCSVGSASF